MQLGVRRDDPKPISRRRFQRGGEASRLGDEELSRGSIPDVHFRLEESIEATRRAPRKIERGGAGASNIPYARKEADDHLRLQCPRS